MKTMTMTLDFYVVIPCYNDLSGLIESLNSIHYHDEKFAILIIDDGSDDPVQRSVLKPFLTKDLQLEIIRIPVNMGITNALNAGLQWLRDHSTQFRYVARLDCGDLCDVNRFHRQVEYMDHHPDTDLLGSWCVFRNFDNDESYTYKTPSDIKRIRRGMYFRNIFIHPTVMWRAESMRDKSYPEKFPHAEDYGLFYELIHQDLKCVILPEVLMICRLRQQGLSFANRDEQLKSRIKVIRQFGNNRVLKGLGVLKLGILRLIPYSIVFRIKKIMTG